MKIQCYNSISQIRNLWDRKIGKRSICISSCFIHTLEILHPNDSFFYYVVSEKGKTIGLFFLYLKKYPLIKRKYFSKFTLKILTTSTFETYGKHYWFDTSFFSEERFISLIYEYASEHKFNIFLFRDFVGDIPHKVDNTFKSLKFKEIPLPELSIIKLKEKSSSSFHSFLYSLKKKHRNTYRRTLKIITEQKWQIEYLKDFTPHIEEFYKLYLETNNRAKEYKSKPLKIGFFDLFIKYLPNNTSCILIRNKSKNIIGFVFLFETKTELVPFLLGTKNIPYIWHVITLKTIEYAIQKNIQIVDLGITNSVMKKRMGAETITLTAYGRFKKNINNYLFNILLKQILTK